MTAPLVTRLLSRLQDRLDAQTRGTLTAELACYYARIGEFVKAEDLRHALRAEFSDGRSAPVSIGIMLLEALLLYFQELNVNARDRLLRANLLSNAFRETRLISLTAAWLAHIDFNQGRYDSMTTSIGAVFDTIAADDGTAVCRVAIVLGDAFSFCRQPDPARKWYEAAHQSATTLGDQAAVGALTYNRAALHVSNLRLDSLSGPIRSDDISLASIELRSAVNYQSIAQLKSLNHLLQSSTIGVAILEQRYSDALRVLEDDSFTSEVPLASAESALQRADLAMCLAKVGRIVESHQAAQEVVSMRLDDFGADDRALIFGSIACAMEISQHTIDAAVYLEKSLAALSEHGLIIGAIGALIAKFSEPGRAIH